MPLGPWDPGTCQRLLLVLGALLPGCPGPGHSSQTRHQHGGVPEVHPQPDLNPHSSLGGSHRLSTGRGREREGPLEVTPEPPPLHREGAQVLRGFYWGRLAEGRDGDTEPRSPCATLSWGPTPDPVGVHDGAQGSRANRSGCSCVQGRVQGTRGQAGLGVLFLRSGVGRGKSWVRGEG